MLYFHTCFAYLDPGTANFGGSIPNISHQSDKMEANTGNKGRQATMFLTQDPAHNKLETARMEGNMPMELSTSSQGEHRFGQQGMALHHSFDIILSSPQLRNVRYR